ncbi:MAG: GNAT family N-acetyltransferase [Candidatus Aminicenantes bacterium]|nr:GNAT family N-acetyltransferase [Candidatus Aminicenantes bacterium]
MTIRAMRAEDLDFAAERTVEVNWPGETREVFENFLLRDPAGCFIAESEGCRIGLCVATAYERSGFIGELIVRKETRGRGVGPRLMAEAIAYLRGRGVENIFLDGVARAVPFYESLGFRPVCRSLRFLGTVEGRLSPDVRPMRKGDFPEVRRLDRQAFGDDRGFFLERRFLLYPRFAKVLERGGRLEGFILGLRGRGLISAGPWVVTPEDGDPLALLASLALETAGIPLRVGVLEINKRAVTALGSLPGFAPQHASLRMVLGPSDRLGNSPLCWAVGSPAKG